MVLRRSVTCPNCVEHDSHDFVHTVRGRSVRPEGKKRESREQAADKYGGKTFDDKIQPIVQIVDESVQENQGYAYGDAESPSHDSRDRPSRLRHILPTSYHHASQRFDQDNGKNETSRVECQCGGGPDIDDKKSPGDPDLISGRKKLHGCQMVKRSEFARLVTVTGRLFFLFALPPSYISPRSMC